jgi:hypothetical protein
MKSVVEIMLILVLLVIAYQDYKFRAVWWVLFPIIIALSLPFNDEILETLYNGLTNWIFVFIQLSLLTIYFSIKNKRIVNIAEGLLGWGDILFLFSVSFLFSFPYFISFYVGSLLASLVFVLIAQFSRKSSFSTIPLAGIQACVLMAIILLRILDYSSEFLRAVEVDIFSFLHA